jgi:hypothetical protein
MVCFNISININQPTCLKSSGRSLHETETDKKQTKHKETKSSKYICNTVRETKKEGDKTKGKVGPDSNQIRKKIKNKKK